MTQNADTRTSRRTGRWRLVIVTGLVAAIVVVSIATDIPAKIDGLKAWIESLGVFGPVAYIAIYAVLASLVVPAWMLTVLGAALFGSAKGVVLVSVGSTLGCALSMLGARYLAREFVAAKLSHYEKFQWIDRMTESHGSIIVAFFRLVPILPFNIVNYAFGLTSVPFWTYMFWSWLCMLPMTVVYVVGADAIAQTLKSGEIPWTLVIVFAIAILIVALLVRNARHRLKAADAPDA